MNGDEHHEKVHLFSSAEFYPSIVVKKRTELLTTYSLYHPPKSAGYSPHERMKVTLLGSFRFRTLESRQPFRHLSSFNS